MLRRLPRLARGVGLIAVGALAVATAPWIAEAAGRQVRPAVVSRDVSNIPTGRADALEVLGMACAASDQYVQMPGTTLVFTLGGSHRRPAIVQFSGLFGGFGDTDYMMVRLLVDGAVQPGTGQGVTMSYKEGLARPAGFDFFTARLAPGNHRVTLQYKATTGDGAPWNTCVGDRTLIVLHA